MKICHECGKEYHKLFEGCTKFCSYECKKARRSRVNKANKTKYKDNVLNHAVDHKSLITANSYIKYKFNAIKRGIEFNLSKDDFAIYFQKDCYYCGDKINTFGIDRVNNKIGYIKENIVSCCTTCNFMKRADNELFFVTHCNKVTKNMSLQTSLRRNLI